MRRTTAAISVLSLINAATGGDERIAAPKRPSAAQSVQISGTTRDVSVRCSHLPIPS